MKVYRVNLRAKILSIITGLLIIFSIILIIFDANAPILLKLMVPFMVFFTIVGWYSFTKMKIIIDDTKIKIHMPWKKDKEFFWNEVEEIGSYYILFPEFVGFIAFKPKSNLQRKSLEIAIGGMPVELVRDILSHLPPDTKIYLYPYLKRKVEGKQIWFYVK